MLVQPGNRIRFVRACVRAKLRVAAGRACFRGWVAEARSVLRRGVVQRGACPSLRRRKTTPLFYVGLLIAANRC